MPDIWATSGGYEDSPWSAPPPPPPPKANPGAGWVDLGDGSYLNPTTGQTGAYDVTGQFTSTPIGGGGGGGATGGGGGGGGSAQPQWRPGEEAMGWADIGLEQDIFGWQKESDIWGQKFAEQQWGGLSAWQQAQVAGGQASQAWEEFKYANPSEYDKLTLELDKLKLDSQNHWAGINAAIDQGHLDVAWKGLEVSDRNTNRSLDIQLELGKGQLDVDRYRIDMSKEIANIQAATAKAVSAADNAARIAAAQIQAGAQVKAAQIGAAAQVKVAEIAAKVQREAIALQAELGRRELALKEELFMLEWRRSPADYMAYWGATQPGATQGAPAAPQGAPQAAPQTAGQAGGMWGTSPPTTYGGQGTPTQAPQWLTTTLAGQAMGEQQMPQWGFERGPAPY
mgnify:CR=1 FL=1